MSYIGLDRVQRSARDEPLSAGGPVLVTEQASRRVVLPSSAVAVRSARTELAGFLHASGVDGGVVDDAVVILSELVTNAVRHATPGPDGTLRIEWTLDQRLLRLKVTDGGRDGTRSMHDRGAVGGRGLSIVAALADSWSLERAERGTTVTAVLQVA